MNKLTKPKAQLENSAARPEGLPEVGGLYISHRGDVYKIIKVFFRGPRARYGANEWRIVSESDGRRYEESFREWQSYKRAEKLEHDTLEEAEAWALAEFNQPTLQGDLAAGPESTALTVPSTKQKLIAARDRAEIMRRRAEVVTRLMERRLQHFEKVRREMEAQLSTLNANIRMIELYLGVYEQVYVLCDGIPASADTPISLRQLVLYMDEEVGDTRRRKNGQYGIDWESIEDFDKWVLEPGHLDRLLPEPKGIVAIQPSRQRRKYSEDALTQALLSEKNKKVCLLIRNGEKLFRVYTDYIPQTQKLFPGPDEIANVLASAEKSGSFFDEQDARDLEKTYINNALILQGLIDRSEIFRPVNAEINLFKAETYNGLINFIYDGEPSLTDGHIGWDEWRTQVNSRIQRGSRVLLAESMNTGWHYDKEFLKNRVLLNSNYLGFQSPDPGVYTVEAHPDGNKNRNGTEQFVILYNPGDTVYPRDYWRYGVSAHTRKRRVSFQIYKDDYFVLNYDGIGLEDIEYFLASRLERHHFLYLVPVLYKLRDERRAELAQESEFVKLVAGQNGFEESAVWAAVEWWKNKVIWKRPITKDDKKAWRMIIQKLKRDAER